MGFEFAYPVVLTEEPSGGFLVSSPDFPELLTSGDDRADAVVQATDALEEVFAARLRLGEDIPEPSVPPDEADVEIVRLPPTMAAKAAATLALRERGMSQSSLARKVGLDEKEIRRLLDPRHPSKLQSLQRVLQALDRNVEIRLVELVNPEIRETQPRSYNLIVREAERFAGSVFPRAVSNGTALPIHELLSSARLSSGFGRPLHVVSDPDLREEAVCEHSEPGPTLRVRTDVWAGVEAGSGRYRFTLAHEIGHLALHGEDLARHGGRAFRDIVTPTQKLPPDVPIFRSPEWQANVWAAALLMPLEGVRSYLQRLRAGGCEFTREAFASNFQVSTQAAEIRLEKLLPALLS